MQRRDFLKGAAAASLLFAAPVPFARRAFAQQSQTGLFFFMVDARGGWDVTSSLDPKGGDRFSSYYSDGDIRETTSGGIRYAPKNAAGDDYDVYGPLLGRTGSFFEKYRDDLVVINGIDTKTNSHDLGPRHTWSGTLRLGYPNFGGLAAAVSEQQNGLLLPLAMISTGGFDSTSDLTSVSRSSTTTLLRNALAPSVSSPGSPLKFLHEGTHAIIEAAERERRNRYESDGLLPTVKQAMQRHWAMRDVEENFSVITARLEELPAPHTMIDGYPNPNDNDEDDEDDERPDPADFVDRNRLIDAVGLAVAGMRSNKCVAAMLSLGGFDTHSNHDATHRKQKQKLFDVVDYIKQLAAHAGIYDRTVILVGSDFGRTVYNSEDVNDASRGKDHWPVTSMMALGGPISGGRTVGETDNGAPGIKGHRALPQRVTPDGVIESAGAAGAEIGEVLTPARIHQALRALSGVEGNSIANKFPLEEVEGPAWPIFN